MSTKILVYLTLCMSGVWSAKIALIVIDVQTCFTQGGTLAVTNGSQVVPVINSIREEYESHFDLIVFSQDWHCADHVSFASQHDGYNALDTITLHYNDNGDLCRTENVTGSYTVNCSSSEETTAISQTLWPDHCVINTTDAELHPQLIRKPEDTIIQKGYNCHVDSYSTFYDNGGFYTTNLQPLLEDAGIDTVFVTGLATDFCVYWSSKDALKLGYKTYVIEDATRGVVPVLTTLAVNDMKQKGIHVVQSADLQSIFDDMTSKASSFSPYQWHHVICILIVAVVTSVRLQQ